MATSRSKAPYAGKNPDAPAMHRSHCSKGHDQSVVGRYLNGQCKECKRIQNAEKAKKAGGWRKVKESRRRGMRGGHTPTTGVSESGRLDYTNTIIPLDKQRDRAATWWEREDIQKQINELARRVTA